MSDTWSTTPDLPYDASGPRSSGPAEEVGPNGFLPSADRPAGTLRHSGSRWRGDSVTLSRWGRVGVTIALLVPVAWMIFFMGIGGIMFLALYCLVLPVALRDVWRRTVISTPYIATRARPAGPVVTAGEPPSPLTPDP